MVRAWTDAVVRFVRDNALSGCCGKWVIHWFTYSLIRSFTQFTQQTWNSLCQSKTGSSSNITNQSYDQGGIEKEEKEGFITNYCLLSLFTFQTNILYQFSNPFFPPEFQQEKTNGSFVWKQRRMWEEMQLGLQDSFFLLYFSLNVSSKFFFFHLSQFFETILREKKTLNSFRCCFLLCSLERRRGNEEEKGEKLKGKRRKGCVTLSFMTHWMPPASKAQML